jgi:hypothetical protein
VLALNNASMADSFKSPSNLLLFMISFHQRHNPCVVEKVEGERRERLNRNVKGTEKGKFG